MTALKQLSLQVAKELYCRICDDEDIERQKVEYKIHACVSSKCNSSQKENICPFRYRMTHCAIAQKYYVKTLNAHINKFEIKEAELDLNAVKAWSHPLKSSTLKTSTGCS